MKQDIVVPRMGESISEATIGNILKPTGSAVQADDEILELETDKVNQVLFAPASGIVTLTAKPQEAVKIGQVVGYIETDGKAAETKPAQKESAPKEVESPKAKPVETARRGKEEFLADIKQTVPKAVVAVPSINKATQIRHTEVPKGDRSEKRIKMPKIRRVIAERMVEAQRTAAMLTTFNEVDLTQVIILRERYKELFQKEYNVKLGYLSFFVKAAVSALHAFPEVNSFLDGEDLVYRNYFDIGIAVSTDRGVVVPVVKDCDHKTFAEIEQAIDQFSARARDGTISFEELQGGGFTITNGGVFGSLLSTPILNPPQAAILGMHKIMKRPIAINDQVLIRPMMYLALTYDHRIIDGREAVSFLVHIKQCLEDPSRILLEI